MAAGPSIAFVAGEASGDLLAAGVLEELRRREPAVALVGVGGDRMIAAGFDAWHHVRELSVRGYVEVRGGEVIAITTLGSDRVISVAA